MIYVDTSVVLAHLLAEDIVPPAAIWDQVLVSSRLLEYEAWNRIHARGLTATHGEALRLILGRLNFLELTRPVVSRALNPFPLPVRTLDALHLASIEHLGTHGQRVELATYDQRMVHAARSLAYPLYPL